jgi:excisionase family DNA binding protein
MPTKLDIDDAARGWRSSQARLSTDLKERAVMSPGLRSKSIIRLYLEEAAALSKRSPYTLRRLAEERAIPSTKIGRHWVFPEEQLVAWIKEQSADKNNQTDVAIPPGLTPTVGPEEAGKLLRCSPVTVCRMAKAGKIPGAKVGRSWVFFTPTLLEWLDARCRAPKGSGRGSMRAPGEALAAGIARQRDELIAARQAITESEATKKQHRFRGRPLRGAR